MMRLTDPQYGFDEALDKCIAGISDNTTLYSNTVSTKPYLVPLDDQYLNAARAGMLHTIEPIRENVGQDPIVINNMTKSDLIKLYDQYFVSKGKPAREIYDALLNIAKEKCPFCGGIGTPRNLDHFLPKSHFPVFSVLPRNLVPSCRDCNMDGKGRAFAIKAEEQIIQPYADNDKFFSEQWIYASYHQECNDEPGFFEYYASPPESWSDVEKYRVIRHFNQFDLSKRYGTKAAEMLITVLNQIRKMKIAGLDRQIIIDVLLKPGLDASPFINHWQYAMYQSLIYRNSV